MNLQTTTQVLPSICGDDQMIDEAMSQKGQLCSSNLSLEKIQSGFACALHMHQPTIPAEGGRLISNLQYMFEHPHDGDNHNAGVFAWCYGRMGEFIPKLVESGANPRIMLDYSGNLLWGLEQMGREDILEKLRNITINPRYFPHVEWLGTMWSHAVLPSTPIPDIKLHIRAWQHQFVSIFGLSALCRVRGFSPPEMHLPNHPDTLYEFIKALRECGYSWLLVQEHTVERLDGSQILQSDKYLPNRLRAYNSRGEEISITVLIKTQGSDTKLVAQNQPYHEAKGMGRQKIGTIDIPPLVSQIADGENGGVMMNDYPRDFLPLWQEIRGNGIEQNGVVGINGSEYLELLRQAGVDPADYPICQARGQHKIWQKISPEHSSPEAVESVIAQLRQNDPSFHVDGASWTNNLSWVKGYENVLEPMNQLSAQFHHKFDNVDKKNPQYEQALLYNLLVQTSCFRYWGQGTWTDYARQLYQKGMAIVS